MLLLELIKGYQPVYPEPYSWDDTVEHLLTDPIEALTVNRLLDVLKKEGGFRQPVRLGVAEFEEAHEVPAVLNGTHRIVAYLLFGDMGKDVKVSIESEEEYIPYEENPDDVLLTTSLEFMEPLTDPQFDLLFEILRSFPVSEKLWVTADIAGSRDNVYENMWDIEKPTVDDMEEVHEAVLEILEDNNFPIQILEARTVLTKNDETVAKEVITR